MKKGLLFFVVQAACILVFIGTPLGLYTTVDFSTWWLGGPALVVASLAAMAWAVYGFVLVYRNDSEVAGKATMALVVCYFSIGVIMLVLGLLGILPS